MDARDRKEPAVTDPDRTPRTPDLPPPDGMEVPDIGLTVDEQEEGRAPAEGPTSGQNRSAADTTKAEGEDESPG